MKLKDATLIVELMGALSEAEIQQVIDEIYAMHNVFSVKEAAQQAGVADAAPARADGESDGSEAGLRG